MNIEQLPFKIIECPRDAMQGINKFIPTEQKAKYINKLLEVGFDTIDFGSFVSPKAIPQMKDTAEVLAMLDLSKTSSALLAIIANERGAEQASGFKMIDYLGYPLSVSETFQQRNTNKSIIESLNELEKIYAITKSAEKGLVVYLSMGFGNPYGDPYSLELVIQFVGILKSMGVKIVSIADTVGMASAENVDSVLTAVIKENADLEIGAHLHSAPDKVFLAISSAYKAGVRRMDGAMLGYGGCPMAEDELVGNLSTENIVSYLTKEKEEISINMVALEEARAFAHTIFS